MEVRGPLVNSHTHLFDIKVQRLENFPASIIKGLMHTPQPPGIKTDQNLQTPGRYYVTYMGAVTSHIWCANIKQDGVFGSWREVCILYVHAVTSLYMNVHFMDMFDSSPPCLPITSLVLVFVPI